ncbi:MAG: carbohydrate-binding protein, partial [Rhodanobacter sp.]
TQGNDPASHSGPLGSGQPWTSKEACGGSSPPNNPPPADPPTSGSCTAVWNASTAYGGGSVASENGVNYKA